MQREMGRAAGSALSALGQPATRLARWRFAWLVAYHEEAHFLLSLQQERLTDAWAARHIRRDGAPPPGGAVLISLHHNYSRYCYWRLRLDGSPPGLVASDVREGWDPAHPDYAMEYAARGDRSDYFARRRRFLAWLCGGGIYRPPDQMRAAARFVQAGGNLVIMADGFTYPVWERGDLLGRAIPIAPGPAWVARRTGTDRPLRGHPGVAGLAGLVWRAGRADAGRGRGGADRLPAPRADHHAWHPLANLA
ncbi:MAG: hypothetical protein U0841_04295 [Chloroflexia bacterium]